VLESYVVDVPGGNTEDNNPVVLEAHSLGHKEALVVHRSAPSGGSGGEQWRGAMESRLLVRWAGLLSGDEKQRRGAEEEGDATKWLDSSSPTF